ncbi:MAG: protein-disulfide isomerase [Alcanivorax sp.]|nr:protein-disulfide isomerase [Alcanivorax sp.]MAY10079.1 protein-disulfide isomerase [Alcanivorax sp.]MBI54234.1 protein-disulfide isomerase [Alcanivorax sp.]MBU57402.1 protein-disulfide isomerase [Alcanivorax sp.]HCE38979.1 protein-disulfide isomerase [Alcanivorax sp.]
MKALTATVFGLFMVTTAVVHADAGMDEKAFRAEFKAAFPRANITAIKPSPADDLMEVELNGREIVYASKDGQLIFTGDVIQMRDGDVVNLKEERYEKVRREGLANVDMASMITYPAEGDEKTEIYAFTDITCGYCRKLHRHIEDYTQAGITVHYLAFPRGGPTSQAAKDMRHIWCDADPRQALTAAKLNDQVSDAELADCADVVDREYRMGLDFGVRGTPAIYTAEGAQLGGYVTPEQLNQRLGL